LPPCGTVSPETPAPNVGRTDRSLSPSPTGADLLGEHESIADLLELSERDEDLLRELNTPEPPLPEELP